MTIRGLVFALGFCIAGLLFGGCESLDAFNDRIPPAYNLQDSQQRKILVWIECPKSLNDQEILEQKLEDGFVVYMTQKMEISRENIITEPSGSNSPFSVDPIREARRLGAGYLLLVQVDHFEMTNLQIRDLYSGSMVTRSLLLDVDTGLSIWPKQPEGKMVSTAVEMEKGHNVVQGKLISGTIHCILRYLYPCPQVQYKHSTERISTQEVFELETY